MTQEQSELHANAKRLNEAIRETDDWQFARALADAVLDGLCPSCLRETNGMTCHCENDE